MLCIDPNLGGYTSFMGPYLDTQQSLNEGYTPTDGVVFDGAGLQVMILMGYFGSAVIGSFLVVSHHIMNSKSPC